MKKNEVKRKDVLALALLKDSLTKVLKGKSWCVKIAGAAASYAHLLQIEAIGEGIRAGRCVS